MLSIGNGVFALLDPRRCVVLFGYDIVDDGGIFAIVNK